MTTQGNRGELLDLLRIRDSKLCNGTGNILRCTNFYSPKEIIGETQERFGLIFFQHMSLENRYNKQ